MDFAHIIGSITSCAVFRRLAVARQMPIAFDVGLHIDFIMGTSFVCGGHFCDDHLAACSLLIRGTYKISQPTVIP
jgi:hypothetical protein